MVNETGSDDASDASDASRWAVVNRTTGQVAYRCSSREAAEFIQAGTGRADRWDVVDLNERQVTDDNLDSDQPDMPSS